MKNISNKKIGGGQVLHGTILWASAALISCSLLDPYEILVSGSTADLCTEFTKQVSYNKCVQELNQIT